MKGSKERKENTLDLKLARYLRLGRLGAAVLIVDRPVGVDGAPCEIDV